MFDINELRLHEFSPGGTALLLNNQWINNPKQLNILPLVFIRNKYLLIHIRHNFLPRTVVKFNGIICIEFADLIQLSKTIVTTIY